MDFSKESFKKIKLENGLIRINAQPHTKDIEALTTCCPGQDAGAYYLIAKHFDETIECEEILTELAKLQDTDEASDTYGCMRWYREEPVIRDTNGAFFVLRHIAAAFRLYPEKISEAERSIMLPVFERAAVWFARQCKAHGYFYPNKIMSDGGLLAMIAEITENEAALDEARDFWLDWLSYTDDYGWGWGENTSRCYSVIMTDALNFAILGMKNDIDLRSRLLEKRNELLSYRAFHGDYEYIPSIRTYNFNGLTNQNATEQKDDYFSIAHAIVTESAPEYTPPKEHDVFHKEHIFADSYAYTYKGENIRLGTINKFPVMPGCYQNEEWGLGWQSMPVSVLAKKHETGFLRFITETGGKYHAHPALDKHSCYLFNRLFEDENIPDCFTVSKQVMNTAVIVRGMYHIANKTSYIGDEWYFQHFAGEFSRYKDWYVLNYGDCVLAIQPLGSDAEVTLDGEKIRISQVAYSGEDKLVSKRKWIAAWAVVALDSAENYRTELDKITASYEVISDLRYPRIIPPIKISCGKAELTFDPNFDI